MVTALPLALLDSGLVGERRIIPLTRRRYWQHPKLARVATLAEQQEAIDTTLAGGALVYTDAYSLAVVRYNPGYEVERRAIEAYCLAPVAGSARNGRVLLFQLVRGGQAGPAAACR
jgi:hypothetical protein